MSSLPLASHYSPSLRPSAARNHTALASSPNRSALARPRNTHSTLSLAAASTQSLATFRTTHEEAVASVAVHLVIPPRPPPALPSPVPVLHSSAFLQAAVSGSYDEVRRGKVAACMHARLRR